MSQTGTEAPPVPIATTEAARILELSVERVRQLDKILRPIKMAGGRRIYDEAHVRSVAAERAAKRGGG